MGSERRKTRIHAAALGMVLFLACFAVSSAWSAEQAVIDADLVVDASTLSGVARFFPVVVDGFRMEVIMAKAPDGGARVVFNACQVCYRSGKGVYVQDGGDLVCQSCRNRFPIASLETARGGCNPVPVGLANRTESGGSITVPLPFLRRAKQYFSTL